MHNKNINDELVGYAKSLASPTQNMNLFDVQFVYWLSIKELMSSGGYPAVKKQIPHISKAIADLVHNSSYIKLKKISLTEFCMLKPAICDRSIIDLLNNDNDALFRTQALLEILAQEKNLS